MWHMVLAQPACLSQSTLHEVPCESMRTRTLCQNGRGPSRAIVSTSCSLQHPSPETALRVNTVLASKPHGIL